MKVKRFKFNFFDFFIFVVVLAVVVFYSYYLNNISKNDIKSTATPVSAEVLVEVEKIRADYLQGISVGDAVAFADDGNILGNIRNISVSDIYIENDENSLGVFRDTEYKKAIITIKCDLNEIGIYFYSGDNKVVIGETYNFIIPDAYIVAKCTSVSIVD